MLEDLEEKCDLRQGLQELSGHIPLHRHSAEHKFRGHCSCIYRLACRDNACRRKSKRSTLLSYVRLQHKMPQSRRDSLQKLNFEFCHLTFLEKTSLQTVSMNDLLDQVLGRS